MEITNLEKHGKDKYYVYLDNSFFCSLNAETIVKNGLKTGLEIEKEQLEEIQFENEKLTAFDISLKYLANIKTEKQVRDYLYKKGYKAKIVDNTIEKLSAYKYLNDLAYAKLYVKSYKLSKGKRILKYELQTKGVAEEYISSALSEIGDENEAIEKLAIKYLKNKTTDQKVISKLFNHLLNKGFNFEDINCIIKKLCYNKIYEDVDHD